MVEAIANSAEYYLTSGLDFKISPGASYIVDRKSVTWFASGSQNYVSGRGARVVRIQMNSDGWVDPSTVRLNFTLNNTSSTLTLRPIGGPWSMFSRVRCMYQGAIVDDISAYNRTHEMMSILTSKANRENDDVSGFGRRWDDETYYPSYAGGSFRGGGSYHIEGVLTASEYDFGGIAPNESKSTSFKPMCGLLCQGKYLPMMWGGLVFEFEIISDKTEAFADGVAGGNF